MDSENKIPGRKSGCYMNTSLPLLPNVRKTEIKAGDENKFKLSFDVSNRTVKLYGCMNSRHNRYLKSQYARMLKSLGCFTEWKGFPIYKNGVPVVDSKGNPQIKSYLE